MTFALARKDDRIAMWDDTRGYIRKQTLRLPSKDSSVEAWVDTIKWLVETTGEEPMMLLRLLRMLEVEGDIPDPQTWMQVLSRYEPGGDECR